MIMDGGQQEGDADYGWRAGGWYRCGSGLAAGCLTAVPAYRSEPSLRGLRFSCRQLLPQCPLTPPPLTPTPATGLV